MAARGTGPAGVGRVHRKQPRRLVREHRAETAPAGRQDLAVQARLLLHVPPGRHLRAPGRCRHRARPQCLDHHRAPGQRPAHLVLPVAAPLCQPPLRCRAWRGVSKCYSGRASSHCAARSGSPPCPRCSRNAAALLVPTFSARAHAMNRLSETPSCRAQSSAAALSNLGRFNETRAFMMKVSPHTCAGSAKLCAVTTLIPNAQNLDPVFDDTVDERKRGPGDR